MHPKVQIKFEEIESIAKYVGLRITFYAVEHFYLPGCLYCPVGTP